MTSQINVDVHVTAVVPNSRTFALACIERLDVNDYANQMSLQNFCQQYKDDTNYRFAVVELKYNGNTHTGNNISLPMSGTLYQIFDSFNSVKLINDNFSTYTVYVITYQSPDARNPTIKVVSSN